jgi:peptidylamidoglycolate lyase
VKISWLAIPFQHALKFGPADSSAGRWAYLKQESRQTDLFPWKMALLSPSMRFFWLSFLLVPCCFGEPKHLLDARWPDLPRHHTLGLCAGIGVDAQNRVFVFHRGERKWSKPFPKEPIASATVSVIDGQTGKLLAAWGSNQFIMPHGLSVAPDGHVWLTDVGLHQVFKCTPEGKVLMTLGEAGVPGADEHHFNLPTDIAFHPDGSLYVSDGYQNTRVMKFTAAGKFVAQWGTPGQTLGAFKLPHGIAIDAQGRIIVCDRENHRLQFFDSNGIALEAWSGDHIGKPYGVATAPDGRVLIIDGGLPSLKSAARGKAVVLDANGQVLETIGSYGSGPGQFRLGHDIAIGPDGTIYVAEGTGERVQKFVRP